MELYDIYMLFFHWVLGKAGRYVLRIEPMAFVHAIFKACTPTLCCAVFVIG